MGAVTLQQSIRMLLIHWPVPVRWLCLPVAFALALLTTGCSSFDEFTVLGYKPGPQFDRSIRTVRVPVCENKTFVRGLEIELTEAVIKEIEKRTPWKVVQEDADAELRLTILGLPKRVILPNQLNEVRQAELTLSVEMAWYDLRTCPDLPSRRGPQLPPPPPPPLTNASDPLAPLPPPTRPLAPILVQRSVTFIPELGESYATARQKVVSEMAEQIVSLLEVPW
jgi:hypothetical protein